MEPTQKQHLIINALDTLEWLGAKIYDEDTGDWYIRTPSPINRPALDSARTRVQTGSLDDVASTAGFGVGGKPAHGAYKSEACLGRLYIAILNHS